MFMKLRPMADNIVLKATEAEETTASGIILAAATREKPAIYEVMSAGPEVKEIKVGDKVIVSKFIGGDIKLDGVEYKFVKLEDVLALVTD